MSAETTLEKAFNAYLRLARAELRPQQVKRSNVSRLELIKNPWEELRDLVNGTEMRHEFRELVKQTLFAFPDSEESEASRFGKIRNFFRRSRCYISIYNGEPIEVGITFQDLENQFRKKQIQSRYLIPLMDVRFSTDVIDFGHFQVRRFSAEQLDEILANDVNKVFYESSTVKVSEIKRHWFIYLEQDEPLDNSENADIPPNADDFVHGPPITYDLVRGPEGPAIVTALEPFVLYDWDKHNVCDNVRFKTPFHLESSNYLLDAPHWAPMIETNDIEMDEEEQYPIFVDDEKLDSFQSHVTQIYSILKRLRSAKTEWHFIEVALLFLRVAFFSEGLQQLLWNITVIDALLGDERKFSADSLGKRLASVLGKNEEERKDIRASFRGVYDLRSRLVHGGPSLLTMQADDTPLAQARNLAIRAAVWLLHYLDHVLETSINDRNEIRLPTREELLRVLDIDIESKESVIESNQRVNRLLRNLPPDFPHTTGWLNQ